MSGEIDLSWLHNGPWGASARGAIIRVFKGEAEIASVVLFNGKRAVGGGTPTQTPVNVITDSLLSRQGAFDPAPLFG